MKTITLDNEYNGWYRSKEFSICREGVKPLLGDRGLPRQIRISVSHKAFKGSKRASWSLDSGLRFGDHRVWPPFSAECWALDNGFVSLDKTTTFYIKIEPLP